MRFPRMTTRRWMIAVMAVAAGFFVFRLLKTEYICYYKIKWISHNEKYIENIINNYVVYIKSCDDDRCQTYRLLRRIHQAVNDPRPTLTCREHLAGYRKALPYYRDMHRKYHHAAWHPWEPLSPDPPEPWDLLWPD